MGGHTDDAAPTATAVATEAKVEDAPAGGAGAAEEVVEEAAAGAGHKFRDFKANLATERVREHYRQMRSNQTLEFVTRMEEKYLAFDKCRMTIKQAFEELNDYVDCSDPDITVPNVYHAFQTSEGARLAGEPDWFVLMCLLHDVGKIMFKWGRAEDGQQGTYDGPQWALGGDTWVVGARIPDGAVFPEFNELNADHRKYKDSEFGVYSAHCGMNALKYAFGHDEYMYQMLKFNKVALPDVALSVIRLHSCYPWHDAGEYRQFMNEEDQETLKWVKRFNQYDLYTKEQRKIDMDALWPIYDALIEKFCPGELCW